MGIKYDLIGKKFNQLTVIEKHGTDAKQHVVWECICDCGNKRYATTSQLIRGSVKRCKECRYKLVSEKMATHREEPFDLWKRFALMKNRCYNPNFHAYHRYGGRGITVCDEWKTSFESFRDWALANGYDPHLTLDRIDNDGNYCPENCRWVTIREQQNNRSNNFVVTVHGESDTLANWARRANANYGHIEYLIRKKGENPDDVIGPLLKGGDSKEDVRL